MYNIADLIDRWQMKFTADVHGVMDKGEKWPQTTYSLMDSYLTALVSKSIFETPSPVL